MPYVLLGDTCIAALLLLSVLYDELMPTTNNRIEVGLNYRRLFPSGGFCFDRAGETTLKVKIGLF
jgi:hypothetical protein